MFRKSLLIKNKIHEILFNFFCIILILIQDLMKQLLVFQKDWWLQEKSEAEKRFWCTFLRNIVFYKQFEHQFRIDTADDITDKFLQKGISGLNLYTDNFAENGYGVTTKKPISLCIDDLGIENVSAKYFGTSENVIEKIIFKRCDLFQEGIITHATTNLSPSMLQEKYGDRLYSRIREMFNYIVLRGSDRRK